MWLQNTYLTQSLPDHCTQFSQFMWKYLLPATIDTAHKMCVLCNIVSVMHFLLFWNFFWCNLLFCQIPFKNICTRERDFCATFAIVIIIFLGMLNYVFYSKLLFSKQLNLLLIDIYHLMFLEHKKGYVLYIIFHHNTVLETSYFIQQHSHEFSNQRTKIIAILLEIHKSMHRIVFNRITKCYLLCKDEWINKKTELINH